MSAFDFKNLFIFEMANNHQGSLAHGKRIIEEAAAAAKEYGVRAAVKLQFRNLPEFVHPDFRNRKDVKHIPRFMETALSRKDFEVLVSEVRRHGLITMATPFDEASVETCEALDIDVIKVASCSALDFPLLERLSEAGKPVIISVGGLSIKDIDRAVSFLEHRGVEFAIEHCVAIYPTPPEKLHLHQIEVLRNRYPKLTVGFSTHESPDNTSAIGLAYAKGARIFEKHIGIATETITLNAYSASPAQLRRWLAAYKEAVAECGDDYAERPKDEKEQNDLSSLRRGVFAKADIPTGKELTRDDVFFAMPWQEGQLSSGDFRKKLVADKVYAAGKPIAAVIGENRLKNKKDYIYPVVHAVKGMLSVARIPLSHDFTVEISHHYGLPRFEEVGCVIITCINREYAKKLIIQLPGQTHPVHYHKKKDETFQMLSGELEVEVEGKRYMLYPGDTLWVPRGIWHSFKSATGAIFEEISTRDEGESGDSYYVDKELAKKPREERKTQLHNWGRHQFDETVSVPEGEVRA
ncbi:MAG: N-acetylneuraminate synthase family protein [bacterium]|nr:N-acetylneuraminate synthase family protein [bacterium]